MHEEAEREKFVMLRASGLSYEQIRLRTKISKPTLIKWDKEFREEIIKYQKERTNELLSVLLNDSMNYLKEMLSERNKAFAHFKKISYDKLSKNELVNIISKLDSLINKNLEYLSATDINLNLGVNSPYRLNATAEAYKSEAPEEITLRVRRICEFDDPPTERITESKIPAKGVGRF
ncbi:MAG TPA: hypothetical protein PLZ15_10680 [Melioribacteraceae bacterium]|nr:hypothetical protein [Melioribacteraceae bacterium]